MAPQEHLGVLIEPPGVGALVPQAADPLDTAAILDTTIGELRQRLRRRLDLSVPVIMTGHQAEFSHAGVFAKSIAAATLATKHGGTATFLCVDSDVPKATWLAVPHVQAGYVRRVFIDIPGCDPRLAIEWQPRVPRARWRDFFDSVAAAFGGREHAALRAFADAALDTHEHALDFRDVLHHGRVAVERLLGLDSPRELRVSQIAQTAEFRAFAGHLMVHAEEFARAYNQAQRAYRQRHRVRNAQRPAPLLASVAGRVELPLWVTRPGQARRRLFAAQRGDQVHVFAADEGIGSERLSRLTSAENLETNLSIEENGWRLRPRALALSAFARLFLADLFIHGIGGAKYDEATEDFIERFLGVELPPACCASATVHLPLPTFGANDAELASARRAQRDLRFNPQRHLRDLPADLLRRRAELIGRSDELRRDRRLDRAERRRVFEGIRQVNADLMRRAGTQATALERGWRELERRHGSDRAALDRAYFFGLHPRESLELLLRRIGAACGCA